MIKADRVDDHEFRQVVFVWHIIAMPGDDIVRRMVLPSFEERSLELRNDFVFLHVAVLEPDRRCEKVTRISESVGTERDSIGSSDLKKEFLGFYPIGPRSGSLKCPS